MSWEQYHPVPYQSRIKERLLTVPFIRVGLSFSEAVWWLVGGVLSFQMARFVPRLGTDWLYSRLHYAVPFAVCMFLCYGRHAATGLPVWKYFRDVLLLRLRPRKYLYRKASVEVEA